MSLCPSHDLSSGWIMAGCDLSRYRIMASYVLKLNKVTGEVGLLVKSIEVCPLKYHQIKKIDYF